MKNSYPKPLLPLRLSVIGLSCSGKSTLSATIARKLNIPVLHLDQIAHEPNSRWKAKPKSALIEEQAQFLKENETWVIEGNYTACMEERFSASTLILWLDLPQTGCLYRYIRRSFASEDARPGRLEGAKNEFSWRMIGHILHHYPKRRHKYETLIKTSGKASHRLRTMKELQEVYEAWELPLP